MVFNELIDNYISSHIETEPQLLQDLSRQTYVNILNPRMLCGHLEGRLLKMLTKMCGAKRILELGTFTGYSALCFAEALPEGGEVITIDCNDELYEFTSLYFRRSPYGKKIKQKIGRALDIIPTIEGVFDLVFIDADKREYLNYYNSVLPLVKKGGYILADNTLWDGHVVEPTKHGDEQTAAVKDFNDMVVKDENVETVIVPLRDGLTIIRKK